MAEANSSRGSGARTLALLKLVAEFGGEFSLSDLAAFGARADPAVEAALGDLSRHLLARMAGRMRSEVIHPGWLDSI